MNLIKVGFKFIKGIFSPKKKEYILKFVKEENNKWYIDMPWPGKKDNLEMVFGANRLLSYFGDREVVVSVIPSNEDNQPLDGYLKLSRDCYRLTRGAFYDVPNVPTTSSIWICPVTLCVLGKYPKYVYIKKLEQ